MFKGLWMELISRDALISFMDYRDVTVRGLADRCLVPDPDRPGRTKPLHPSLVGHLRSGNRKTCSPSTAKAIEKALNAPPGSLFAPRMARRAA